MRWMFKWLTTLLMKSKARRISTECLSLCGSCDGYKRPLSPHSAHSSSLSQPKMAAIPPPSVPLSEAVNQPICERPSVLCCECFKTFASNRSWRRHFKRFHISEVTGPSGESLPQDSSNTPIPTASPSGEKLPVDPINKPIIVSEPSGQALPQDQATPSAQ